MTFDGSTFDERQDGERLESLLVRVARFMDDGCWHTLAEVCAACGGTEASCSARLRDLRKERHGGRIVDHRRVRAGLWRYRLVPEREALRRRGFLFSV